MIIENPDAFKSWLTSILEPLCDADPAALAKYVYALVKKDKPLDELREVMVDQLDVFLQQETKPFVEMLFKALESNDYLKLSREERPLVSPPPTDAEVSKEPEIENHAGAPLIPSPVSGGETRGRSPCAGTLAVELAPDAAGRLQGAPTSAAGATPGPVGAAPGPVGAAPGPAGAAPGPVGPVRARLVLSRQTKLPAPPITGIVPRGHPHNEHTLIKVLPLSELLEEPVDQPPRRRDRRGDTARDVDRRRRRSRSWERRARARRHGRDNEHNNDVRRRPLSRSPSPRGRYRNRSPPLPAVDRLNSRSRSRSPTIRDRDRDERERERLRVPRELERDRMSRDREHRDRVSRSRDRERSRERSRDRSRGSTSPHTDARLDHNDAYKRRCRDFDEKGYCMRGDLCQWDHGSDPVVLEDASTALSTVLALPPAPSVPEYNPLTPDIWCGGFPPYPPPHPHHPHPPRELIPIPRIRHDPPMPRGATGSAPPRHPPPHKKSFDYNRFGSARPPLPANAANCSLEVKKVPRGLNDITHLNNHFCKFGKIVNIQVCYDGDPEAALITFSNPTEANVAYKSTEAVLNNRFIKVFWHNPENKQENMAPGGQLANKQTDRQNSQHPMSHNKVLINRDNIKATADHNAKQLMEKQEKEKELANGQEPKKEIVKQSITKSKQVMEMHKRAQALLETQLQQQMLLIQRLESGNVTGTQRNALLEAINSAQEGIEKLRKELVAYNGTLKQMQQAKKPKTKEEAQKEILDAELDLFTKQQEGQDVTELTKRIAELRRQMSLQFPSHNMMRRPHASYRIVKRKIRGGRFNTPTRFTRGGITTKMFSVNQSVDHRPRALLISGFEADELDALLVHFSQYGEVISKEVELSVPQLVLQYKCRLHAEHAAANGKHYNDRTLSITWTANTNASTNSTPRPAPDARPARNGDTREDKDEVMTPAELPEDTLLRFDEEEEEDADEDRSWRR